MTLIPDWGEMFSTVENKTEAFRSSPTLFPPSFSSLSSLVLETNSLSLWALENMCGYPRSFLH